MRKMVFKITTAISALLILGYFAFNGKGQKGKSPCEIIDSQMASGILHHHYFKNFKEKKGSYPESLDQFYEFLRSSESGYDQNSISIFERNIADPYTKSDYKYFAIKVDGQIVDYLLYSLGPNKKDDNRQELEDYDRGIKDKILFRDLVFDCSNKAMNKSNKKADIIVRVPGLTLNKQFMAEFIDP